MMKRIDTCSTIVLSLCNHCQIKKGTFSNIHRVHEKQTKRNEEIFFDSFHNVYARFCKKLNNIKFFANISNIFLSKIKNIFLRISKSNSVYLHRCKHKKMQDRTHVREIKQAIL